MLFKFLIKFSTFPSLIISNMDDQIQNQSKTHFLPFPWLTVTLLGSSSFYAVSSSFNLLTCSTLILSTFAFVFLRMSSHLKASLIINEVTDTFTLVKEEKYSDEYYSDESLLSTSCDETSASDESEWSPFGDDPDSDPTQECSDGSISDEESLIELDPKKPIVLFPIITKCGFQQKYWNDCYYSNSVEIYDEDNMIEIDLAVGSIKCSSRFEIR